jgi:hypothetical protein
LRYYDLTLINSQGQVLQSTSAGFVPSTTGLPTFSSRVKQQNGQFINNPGALNIEFDLPIVGFALPQGGSWLRISGIGLRTIGQASNLNANPATGTPGAKFILSGGMMKGLPLANPAQAGILAQGQIYTAYGNWQGPEQSLEMTLLPADLNPPNGISFVWMPGQELSAALGNSLAVAFPALTPAISILSGMLHSQSSQNVVGWYESLSQFASYIFQMSKTLGAALTGNNYYPGVIIGFRGNTVYATDATQNPRTVQLAFSDLIGQPTWIAPNQISFKCVLRADIQVADMVTMPPDPGTGGTSIISALALTQQGAAVPGAPTRNSSVFKGSFMVKEVHHFANLRQPDADSWATAFVGVATGGNAAVAVNQLG